MDTNEDLISVIIPAYNHEKYVQESIYSIIDQRYKNIELIVIDDGSTDNTWEKINELKKQCEKRFVRVVFRKQKNHGIVKTFDKTLYEANGKYIYYIASDDISHPNAIETLHKNIGDAGLIFPDISWIDSDGKAFFLDENHEKTYDPEKAKYKTAHQSYTNIKWPNLDKNDFDAYAELLSENFVNIGFLLLKQAAIEVGGWKKDVIIEDYYLYLQIVKYYNIKRISDVLFFYRRHNTNCSNNSSLMQKGIRRIFKNERKYCYKNGYRELWNKIFFERYYMDSSPLEKIKISIKLSICKLLKI